MERGGAREGGDQGQGVLAQVEETLTRFRRGIKCPHLFVLTRRPLFVPSGAGPARQSPHTRTANATAAENAVTMERARRRGRRGEEVDLCSRSGPLLVVLSLPDCSDRRDSRSPEDRHRDRKKKKKKSRKEEKDKDK